MSWNEERSRGRIRRFIDTVPQGEIIVEDFVEFAKRSKIIKAEAGLEDLSEREALMHIPRNRAISTHGVHVYANLMRFNDVLVDAGRETEASHRRALEFLHAHYAACDALVVEFDLQRVDFHGSRLHAVVLTPEGRENEPERIRKGIAFAAAFQELVDRLGEEYPQFETPVRIGLDSGPAVAIDGGKSGEHEPLFIGSPANHAAKLAAGDEPGLFVSERLTRVRDPDAGFHQAPRPFAAHAALEVLDEYVGRRPIFEAGSGLEVALAATRRVITEDKAGAAPSFSFHYHVPPLKTIEFVKLPPSNAIRMPTASIFADVDGFTAYIDTAIARGNIAEAVANLHVIRAEMAAVVRDDFDGRKVRFIGDCVHAVIADGTATAVNAVDTVRLAVMTAGGIRSSFNLCRRMLPGIEELGIAIGIDFGETPICRLGLRGEGSVRAATSRSTCVSEAEQQRCDGSETAVGERALAAGPAVARQVFGADRKIRNLDYANAGMLMGALAAPHVAPRAVEPMRAHEPERTMRAHAR